VALTARGPELLVNPGFFMDELTTNERVAVIKHEALHLVFRHLYRKLPRGGEPRLFNIAADLVVNQHIAPWPVPKNAATLKLFPDLDLKPDQSLDWYYARLAPLLEEMRGKDLADTSAPVSAEALTRLMGSQQSGDHRFWAASGGFDFAEEERSLPVLGEALCAALESDIERQIAQARQRTSDRQWGAIPLGIRNAIAQVDKKRAGKVDWRRTLRIFAGNGYRTRIVPTNKRPSKRFGTFPGTRVKREQRIAVVVDTSGSVSAKLVSAFFTEIHAVWRAGTETLVIECDAAVQWTYRYEGVIPKNFSGGGGTDFDPAFRWLREPRNGRFDACIYLTDGFGPEPQIRPPCPVMWFVTAPAGLGAHLKWGEGLALEID
jgi:predicted metal-dependent peptidase